MIPANLLIITLFKKAGPKIDKSAKEDEYGSMGSLSGTKMPISSSGIDLDEKSGKI